jgi:hypothetical protein
MPEDPFTAYTQPETELIGEFVSIDLPLVPVPPGTKAAPRRPSDEGPPQSKAG